MERYTMMRETYKSLQEGCKGLQKLLETSRDEIEQDYLTKDIAAVQYAMLSCDERQQDTEKVWNKVFRKFNSLDKATRVKVIELATGNKVYWMAEMNLFMEKESHGDYMGVLLAIKEAGGLDTHAKLFSWDKKTKTIRFARRFEELIPSKQGFAKAVLESDELMKVMDYSEKRKNQLRELAAQEK